MNDLFEISLPKKTLSQQAFSIVEVSIVLVVSGLLLFSAFKGAGIIKKSKITALVKQLREIDNGTKAFYNFNGALPGDTMQDTMIEFTNQSKTIDIKTGFPTNRGDGDGLIEFGYGSDKKVDRTTNQDCNTNPSNYANEATLAMYHLYYGNYISSQGISSSNKDLYTIRNPDVAKMESTTATSTVDGVHISFFGISDKTTATLFPTKANSGLSFKGNTLMIGGIYTSKASFASNQLSGSTNSAVSLISVPLTFDGYYYDRAGCAPSNGVMNNELTDGGCGANCYDNFLSLGNLLAKSFDGNSNCNYNTLQHNDKCSSNSFYYPIDPVLKADEADGLDKVIDDGNAATGVLRSFICSYSAPFSGAGEFGNDVQEGYDVFIQPLCSLATSSQKTTPRTVVYMLNNI
jgi:type II secretory pathway pseudopilin PulG